MAIPDLPPVSRRSVLKGAAAGAALAAFRAPDVAAATEPARHGIFGYGVASGDPLADRVIIWTRATPPLRGAQKRGREDAVAAPGSGLGDPLLVHWEVAADPHMRRIVKRGRVTTSADCDHTVKVDVTGLRPYTRYWYRFRAEGQSSVIGRTQTAPDIPGETHALRMALVSCSNYTGGYFGAYRAIATRDDLDMVVHVGDYIYEYGNGADRYGPATLRGVRDAQPADEIVRLTDYRLRHAIHKADPDAQAAHRAHPWITIFDDHEIANDAWARGAQNHQPDEGSFRARKAAALRAYAEWMPIRLPDQSVPHAGTRYFRRFSFGTLAQLTVMDTRQNRTRQAGGFTPLGVAATEAVMNDPAGHMPEPAQMSWVQKGISTSTQPWHILAQQTVMSRLLWPGEGLNAPGKTLVNSDQWDGYRHDQADIIGTIRGQRHTDTVVLTGDIHSSWVTELVEDAGRPSAGVEFVGPSVTSDGFYEMVKGPTDPAAGVGRIRELAAAMQAMNPHVKHVDGVGHGWVCVDVTPERVKADWHLTPTPTAAIPDPRIVRTIEPAFAFSYVTKHGSRTPTPDASRIGSRRDEPRRA